MTRATDKLIAALRAEGRDDEAAIVEERRPEQSVLGDGPATGLPHPANGQVEPGHSSPPPVPVVPVAGPAHLQTHGHIPEAAVEAVMLGRYGYVWPRAKATREQIRADIAAALPHLVTEEAVERHARALYALDGEAGLIRNAWDCETPFYQGRYRDDARTMLRAALGIQDEQEVEG